MESNDNEVTRERRRCQGTLRILRLCWTKLWRGRVGHASPLTLWKKKY